MPSKLAWRAQVNRPTLSKKRPQVAGHDRGGRTVHRMCLDHPEKVIKAAIIDIVPTLDMWAAMDKEAAISGWRWPLMAQPADFPERMLGGVDPDWFMRKKLLKLTANLNHIPPEIWSEYVRCFKRKDDPRFMRRLPRRGRHRLRARRCRPRPQARYADSGAVGRRQQRRQVVCGPARPVAIARQ